MECIISYIINPGNFYAQVGDERKLADLQKLVTLIQGFCSTRANHFHSVGNVQVGEILFLKSALRDGAYARGKVLSINADSCSASLIDYGGEEENIKYVLKIDPAVRKFADIEPQARRFSLAFVKPTGGSWSREATELFRENCKDKLIYLPTEDPDHITLIVRQKDTTGSVVDLSVVLIQAGHAKRLASLDNCDIATPSIAASMSDVTLQLRSVSSQTDPHPTSTSATSPIFVRPPPGFERNSSGETLGNGDYVSKTDVQHSDSKKQPAMTRLSPGKASGAYVPPARRGAAKDTSTMYSCLKMANHEPNCGCLVCTIKTALETSTLSHKQRLDSILAVDWPKLSTKEEAVLRCCITGTSLTSEDRELLLNVMLGVNRKSSPQSTHGGCGDRKEGTRKGSVESSTQVTASFNKLVLSSYDVKDGSGEGHMVDTIPNDDITIVRLSSTSPFSEPSRTDSWYPVPSKASGSKGTSPGTGNVPSPTVPSAIPYHLPDCHNSDNWSDPDDDFLENSSLDSEPDFILETSVNTPNRGSTVHQHWTATSTYSANDSTNREIQPPRNKGSPFRPIGADAGSKPRVSVGRGRGSPITNAYSPTHTRRAAASPNVPEAPKSPKRGIKAHRSPVVSYGLGLSAALSKEEQVKPKYNLHDAHPTSSPATDSMSGFGMIMYCTFCGDTKHSSANCPDGTKNLFMF